MDIIALAQYLSQKYPRRAVPNDGRHKIKQQMRGEKNRYTYYVPLVRKATWDELRESEKRQYIAEAKKMLKIVGLELND